MILALLALQRLAFELKKESQTYSQLGIVFNNDENLLH